MNILIKNGIILPMTKAGFFFKGHIGISDNKIALVTSKEDDINAFLVKYDNTKVIDANNCIVMPGLINAHTHVAMALLRGYCDDTALMDWLSNYIWPIEAKLTPEDTYLGAKLGIAEMLLGGTTSFIDMYHYARSAAKAVIDTGIRATVSPFYLDSRMEEFMNDFYQTTEICKGCDRLSVMISPHAPYTCSDENFKFGIELAKKHNVGINTHLAETADETPNYIQTHSVSPTHFLNKIGLFDIPTVAAHGVYLTPEEMDILASKNVTIVNNPKSNLKLSSGIAYVDLLLKYGVNVALGTDGATSNNNLDMWEEMRFAALIQKGITMNPCSIPAYTALEMATVNGAKAMGMEGKLGILKEGALADIIIVDRTRVHHYPHNANIIASLVYSCTASDIKTTIVNGEILVDNGKLQNMDLETICEQSTERLQEILKR